MSFEVYSQVDPRTYATFYVGITNNVHVRFAAHFSDKGGNKPKVARLREIAASNRLPLMERLDTANTLQEARIKEAYWIAVYNRLTTPLLNMVRPSNPIGLPTIYTPVQIAVYTHFPDAVSQEIHAFFCAYHIVATGTKIYSDFDVSMLCFSVSGNYALIHFVSWLRNALRTKVVRSYQYQIDTRVNWASFGDENLITSCSASVGHWSAD